jgi:hypothetical protein
MTVQEWRSKHKRCSFCENVVKHVYHGYNGTILECSAKEQMIVFNDAPRVFCRLYQVRDGDMSVVDHRNHPPMPPKKAQKEE